MKTKGQYEVGGKAYAVAGMGQGLYAEAVTVKTRTEMNDGRVRYTIVNAEGIEGQIRAEQLFDTASEAEEAARWAKEEGHVCLDEETRAEFDAANAIGNGGFCVVFDEKEDRHVVMSSKDAPRDSRTLWVMQRKTGRAAFVVFNTREEAEKACKIVEKGEEDAAWASCY